MIVPRMQVTTGGVALPDFDERVRHRAAVFIDALGPRR